MASASQASTAGADPSVFGNLSCSCQGSASAGDGGRRLDQVNTGIQNGLSDLQNLPYHGR